MTMPMGDLAYTDTDDMGPMTDAEIASIGESLRGRTFTASELDEARAREAYRRHREWCSDTDEVVPGRRCEICEAWVERQGKVLP
ncbi:MAG: hypothetical protein AMXMBFR77_26800 [Phycisphaerales bacterium]